PEAREHGWDMDEVEERIGDQEIEAGLRKIQREGVALDQSGRDLAWQARGKLSPPIGDRRRICINPDVVADLEKIPLQQAQNKRTVTCSDIEYAEPVCRVPSWNVLPDLLEHVAIQCAVIDGTLRRQISDEAREMRPVHVGHLACLWDRFHLEKRARVPIER